MIITATGDPVEFLLAPGAESDVSVLKQLQRSSARAHDFGDYE